jgi:hypothetical protein
MNNDELTTLVREQRTRVPMTIPVDEIIDRGRTLRARRRIPGAAGALVMAVAVVAAVVAVGHGGPVKPAQSKTELAAWTVTKQADGDVIVTIRQLRNPSGLAAALAADGVPAYVAFAGPVPANCKVYPASPSQLQAIYQFHRNTLVIDPAQIPSGTGLFVMDIPTHGQHISVFHQMGNRRIHVGVVEAGAQCPLK